MLVLEFMEGGDLWSALRGPHREGLQWYGRGRSLALDIARGLHFLHEHKARIVPFPLQALARGMAAFRDPAAPIPV